MALLTAPVTLRTRGGSGETHAFPVTNGETIYNGSLVWLDNTTGRCTAGTPAGGTFSSDLASGSNFLYDFLCIATPSGNSVTGDSGGTVLLPVNCGGVVIEGVMVKDATAATNVGDYVFAATNNVTADEDMKNAAATTNSKRAIGHIIRWHSSSNQDIKLYDADVSKVAGKTYHLVS